MATDADRSSASSLALYFPGLFNFMEHSPVCETKNFPTSAAARLYRRESLSFPFPVRDSAALFTLNT